MKAAARANRDYLHNVAEVDIQRVDPSRAKRLLQALARNTAQEHKVARLARETDGDDAPLARTTAYNSRATLRTAARTHFVDPSLAVAALAATPDGLLKDLNTFGFLFESLAVRDLKVYADASEGEVHHYRDSDDLEVDIIVTAGDRWGAFEVKLGQGMVEEGRTTC